MEIIKVKDLDFTYPEQKTRALKDVSFSIEPGEFIVICGESGSGKTTLLKLLKRELAPHGNKTGSIFYKGTELEELDDRTAASEIGYVMQNPENQIVTDKVWHELAFGLENMGVPTPVIRRRVGEMANFFGIHQWFRKKTTELSGGQKQLLNLASIMAMQPELLILDEPTSQLDPIAASDFITTLQKLNRDLGLTIILVEHRLEEVIPIADKVMIMENGSMILYDKPEYIGQKLKEIDKNHKMLLALPSAVRIFNGLDSEGKSPLTVRDGREFLSNNYKNHINVLERPLKEDENRDENILELKNIWFRYERDLPDILTGVNFQAKKGEIISILGGNGSGKTTLLSVMAGQHRPYRGKISIRGKRIRDYKGKDLYRHNIALLPQDPQTVFLKSNVREDYKEIGKVMGYTKEEIKNNTEEIAEMLSIQNLLDKHPYDLSGGEQQKVALGKILLLEPKILLLDEPTKGIDAFSKSVLHDILINLKRQGVTIIMVTHDVEFAAIVSDSCGLFFDGEIISIGTPVDFFSDNNFYTTAANRISRHMYNNAITCEDVIEICKLNGVKEIHAK
ncbi:ATP-binding cassette domain-containing protein [Anaerosalibacter bizertensis]|uniref:ABC transporter ATP-binding protein n=1 Tax=Anaerosalibacter bizertensis TaxID=932217 RepID=UPI001C0ED3BB|nr:ABC transporter ATP-binding protein [Anaerosalibacter bizertensis]MBU5294575.1 ATP-binding cassette domain-containing protein [Anaerosalibacter bizertensis]